MGLRGITCLGLRPKTPAAASGDPLRPAPGLPSRAVRGLGTAASLLAVTFVLHRSVGLRH